MCTNRNVSLNILVLHNFQGVAEEASEETVHLKMLGRLTLAKVEQDLSKIRRTL